MSLTAVLNRCDEGTIFCNRDHSTDILNEHELVTIYMSACTDSWKTTNEEKLGHTEE